MHAFGVIGTRQFKIKQKVAKISFLSPFHKQKDRTCSCLFCFGGEDLDFQCVGYSARKGRFRAPSGKDKARNKEWQSSQNTTDACEGSAMRKRQQFNGTLVFLENLLFSAKKFDKFQLVEFFYPLRKQWYIITTQSWISSPKVYIISRRLYLLSQ